MKLNDIVEVKKDGQHVLKGEKGTIIYVYEGGDFEVEFKDKRVLLLKEDIKLTNKKIENGK